MFLGKENVFLFLFWVKMKLLRNQGIPRYFNSVQCATCRYISCMCFQSCTYVYKELKGFLYYAINAFCLAGIL